MIDLCRSSTLILAPHTDDAELGCGGLISKLISRREVVNVATFSCPPAPGADEQDNTMELEMRASLLSLGLSENNIILYRFKHRIFNEQRQAILDSMIELRETLKPDVVLCPATGDKHQDHQVISQEAIRAFKNSSILGYELPWNLKHFSCDIFHCLSEQNIRDKLISLSNYKSQKNRPYFDQEFVKSLAIVRGTAIGSKYSECFENIKLIVK
tara:strand:- start:744 stop:1382 length:639 start_codon:yes stop_codon:yes gene_type:complete